ncbi:MAG: hypothetical protein H0T73_14415 [Ardenticatenales bacterium]|nr:hypothetical protein [Ardenticatenales bacterium]
MSRRFLSIVLLALLIPSLVACQLGGSEPSPTTEESTPVPSETQGGESSASSSPTSSGPFEVTPPSDTSKANLGGTLLQIIDGEPQGPLNMGAIYLGTILYDENGNKQAAVMDDITSPKTGVDDQGNFVFENVEPGEYALFFWTPMGSVMLKHPETGRDMLFELEAGEALNVGTLAYDISMSAP